MAGWRELAESVTARLERVRVQSGVTQRALAALTGSDQSTVSQFLAARYPDFRISTLIRMATGLRHDVAFVLIPQGEPYRWCGEHCGDRHLIPAADEPSGFGWCHGAPIR